MEPDVQFGSAMMGFNKQDVMTYIESLISSHETECESLKEQIAALNAQLDDKNRLYEALLEKEKDMSYRISELEGGRPAVVGEDPEVLKARLEEEEMRFNELSNEAAQLRHSLDEASAENERLRQSLEESGAELNEYRLQKQNIGSVLMRAQNEADTIMTDAKNEADAIMTDAKNEADAIMTNAENKRREIIGKTNDYIAGVRRLCDEYVSKVASEQSRLKYSADNIVSEFERITSAVSGAKGALDEMASGISQNDGEFGG